MGKNLNRPKYTICNLTNFEGWIMECILAFFAGTGFGVFAVTMFFLIDRKE